ncbi:hypothetical protein K402DRAFT_455492 [Aulographum hederae CBS 113979]|uniref:Uncharacterized protein n=1 Tax=Aulographum hederae CBS 113979 TaxID=1176131 RepID=A0A6G1GVW4_9PEZI|nr:hypothetical protein K402DRAFT_455492 [Aulographum hederae CBS 113979]
MDEHTPYNGESSTQAVDNISSSQKALDLASDRLKSCMRDLTTLSLTSPSPPDLTSYTLALQSYLAARTAHAFTTPLKNKAKDDPAAAVDDIWEQYYKEVERYFDGVPGSRWDGDLEAAMAGLGEEGRGEVVGVAVRAVGGEGGGIGGSGWGGGEVGRGRGDRGRGGFTVGDRGGGQNGMGVGVGRAGGRGGVVVGNGNGNPVWSDDPPPYLRERE